MKKIILLGTQKMKIIGYILFTLSCLIWCIIVALPFFIKDLSKIIIVNPVLLIISEGSFILSIFILGKEFWEKIKVFFKTLISRI